MENDWTVLVRLTGMECAEAVSAAYRNSSDFARKQGEYGDNLLERHVTGAYGEVATHSWMRAQDISAKPLFKYSTLRNRGDIAVGSVEIDVKSWRNRNWDKYGPSLAAAQLSKLTAKADLVVFCRLPDDKRPGSVELVGWSAMQHLMTSGQPTWRSRSRADLTVDEAQLSPMSDLHDRLRRPFPPRPLTQPEPGVCGHQTICGHCWVCSLAGRGLATVMVSERGQGFFHQGDFRGVRSAHGGSLPFAYSSNVFRLRLGEAILTLKPCRFCFRDQHPD